jgi:hypothetical protein
MTRPSQPELKSSSSYVNQAVRPNPNPSQQQYRPPVVNQPKQPKEYDSQPMEQQQELRFLFHRSEDEDYIKSTILNESDRYNERVSFVTGPTLKFQRRQTIYLPPRKKSVIYVMLKEPVVQTELEVVEPPESDTVPEVNIVYEKSGKLQTKHYYSTAAAPIAENQQQQQHAQNNQLYGSASEVKSVTVQPELGRVGRSLSNPVVANPCTPNFSKKLRK